MAVVESAVTSIYICYAEDPSLISRWDAEFFKLLIFGTADRKVVLDITWLSNLNFPYL